MKFGTTTSESVQVPSISNDTMASRKLNFGSTSLLPTKITVEVRSPEGKKEAVDALPVTGNLILNVESFLSILREVAVC